MQQPTKTVSSLMHYHLEHANDPAYVGSASFPTSFGWKIAGELVVSKSLKGTSPLMKLVGIVTSDHLNVTPLGNYDPATMHVTEGVQTMFVSSHNCLLTHPMFELAFANLSTLVQEIPGRSTPIGLLRTHGHELQIGFVHTIWKPIVRLILHYRSVSDRNKEPYLQKLRATASNLAEIKRAFNVGGFTGEHSLITYDQWSSTLATHHPWPFPFLAGSPPIKMEHLNEHIAGMAVEVSFTLKNITARGRNITIAEICRVCPLPELSDGNDEQLEQRFLSEALAVEGQLHLHISPASHSWKKPLVAPIAPINSSVTNQWGLLTVHELRHIVAQSHAHVAPRFQTRDQFGEIFHTVDAATQEAITVAAELKKYGAVTHMSGYFKCRNACCLKDQVVSMGDTGNNDSELSGLESQLANACLDGPMFSSPSNALVCL